MMRALALALALLVTVATAAGAQEPGDPISSHTTLHRAIESAANDALRPYGCTLTIVSRLGSPYLVTVPGTISQALRIEVTARCERDPDPVDPDPIDPVDPDPDPEPPPDLPGVPLYIELEPPQIEIDVGESTTVLARVYDADGTLVPVALEWRAHGHLGGAVTVTDGGVITGTRAGSALVTVRWPGGEWYDLPVTVLAEAPGPEPAWSLRDIHWIQRTPGDDVISDGNICVVSTFTVAGSPQVHAIVGWPNNATTTEPAEDCGARLDGWLADRPDVLRW